MKRTVVALVLGIGLGVLYPVGALLAGEHGGSSATQEHGGGSAAKPSLPGDAAPAEVDDEVGTLREAADALRTTHPDLAAKLDDLADKHAD